MKKNLFIILFALSQTCLSAAEVGTNFWNSFSERVSTLHGFAVEVNIYCQKEEVKSLGLNTHGAIALGDVMKAFLNIKVEKPSTLTEIKKSIKVQIMLAGINEQTTSVTSRILAFSSLSKEQKEEFIAIIDRAGKLMKKVNEDLDVHIYDVSELGL